MILPIFSLNKVFYFSLISSVFWIFIFVISSLTFVLLNTKFNIAKHSIQGFVIITSIFVSLFYFLFSFFYPFGTNKDDFLIIGFSIPFCVLFAKYLDIKNIFNIKILLINFFKKVSFYIFFIHILFWNNRNFIHR